MVRVKKGVFLSNLFKASVCKVKEMMLLLSRKTLKCALKIPQNKILENVCLVTVGEKKEIETLIVV